MKAISLCNEICSGLVLLRRFKESPRFQFLDLVNLVSAKQSNSQHKESSTNGNQAKSWPAVAAAPHLGPSPTQAALRGRGRPLRTLLAPRIPGPPGSLPDLQASGGGPSGGPLRHRTPAPLAAATHFTNEVDRNAVNGPAPGNTAMATIHANTGVSALASRLPR